MAPRTPEPQLLESWKKVCQNFNSRKECLANKTNCMYSKKVCVPRKCAGRKQEACSGEYCEAAGGRCHIKYEHSDPTETFPGDHGCRSHLEKQECENSNNCVWFRKSCQARRCKQRLNEEICKEASSRCHWGKKTPGSRKSTCLENAEVSPPIESPKPLEDSDSDLQDSETFPGDHECRSHRKKQECQNSNSCVWFRKSCQARRCKQRLNEEICKEATGRCHWGKKTPRSRKFTCLENAKVLPPMEVQTPSEEPSTPDGDDFVNELLKDLEGNEEEPGTPEKTDHDALHQAIMMINPKLLEKNVRSGDRQSEVSDTSPDEQDERLGSGSSLFSDSSDSDSDEEEHDSSDSDEEEHDSSDSDDRQSEVSDTSREEQDERLGSGSSPVTISDTDEEEHDSSDSSDGETLGPQEKYPKDSPRFWSQKDSHSCGYQALNNLMEWSGRQPVFNEDQMRTICRWGQAEECRIPVMLEALGGIRTTKLPECLKDLWDDPKKALTKYRKTYKELKARDVLPREIHNEKFKDELESADTVGLILLLTERHGRLDVRHYVAYVHQPDGTWLELDSLRKAPVKTYVTKILEKLEQEKVNRPKTTNLGVLVSSTGTTTYGGSSAVRPQLVSSGRTTNQKKRKAPN